MTLRSGPPATIAPEQPWRWAIFGMIVAKLYLVLAQPIFAIPAADKDEHVFMLLAKNLLEGQWLGPYSGYTLAKGPGYSLFMAGTVVAGVPLPLAQHLLYALACWAVVRVIRPLLPGPGSATVAFALLWWNPMTYEMVVMGRVLRQHLYTPAALFVIAGGIALVTRQTAAAAWRFAWAAVLGLAAGVMWITREETIWIVPSVLLLVVAAVVAGGLRAGPLTALRRALWPVMVAAVLAVLPPAIVAELNARHYGWRGTVEFRAEPFLDAYGALARIEPPDGPKPYLVVTKATRQLLYRHSPAFAELQPHLEGQAGRLAAEASRSVTGIDPAELEIAGGWWMWALRDAVERTPHAQSAGSTLAFYQRLADEINTLADTGQVRARPRRSTLLPVWHPAYTAAAKREAWPFVRYFVTFEGFTPWAPPSIGTMGQLVWLRDLTQWRHSNSLEVPELNQPLTEQAVRWRVAILDTVGRTLRFVNTAVLALGVLAWLATPILRARRRLWPPFAWWASTASFGGAAAVLVITFIIHVTSYPAANPGYFSHAYPLALLGAVLAAAACWRAGRTQPPALRPDADLAAASTNPLRSPHAAAGSGH